VGVGLFGEAQNPCGALYWPFAEWWIKNMGADALRHASELANQVKNQVAPIIQACGFSVTQIWIANQVSRDK
jgi:hypothetical protein